MKKIKSNKASVLILVLWTVAFLSILAVYIGLRVRQRVTFLSRIETRGQMRAAAESGIKKAIAALRSDIAKSGPFYSAEIKSYRHNNPQLFSDIALGNVRCDVSYSYTGLLGETITNFGFVDEERKINLNRADKIVLIRLLTNTAHLAEADATGLAEAIIDWRDLGNSQMTGFYSDSYYDNLPNPYIPKNAPFERLDELLLLKGMTLEIYNSLLSYATIYGDGLVNINTAPEVVLVALGVNDVLAEKIVTVRRGMDGVENTLDDYVFQRTHDIASEMLRFIEMDIEEIKAVDQLNRSGLIKTMSMMYGIRSEARLKKGKNLFRHMAFCIYNTKDYDIKYWNEK